jgi:PhoPQ-activated pathogenicity-related protein
MRTISWRAAPTVSWFLLAIVSITTPVRAAEKKTALDEYVAAPDTSYSWKLEKSDDVQGGRVHRLMLVSQTWQGITWKHRLLVVEPRRITHGDQVLLFITGGSTGREPSEGDLRRYGRLARYCSARVAVLYQVPNQPLLGGRVEDDLISETFLRHLKTKDRTWPLLFPMVKSAVRAMDAVQEVASSKWKTEVKRFAVTGASKRGWTTWLTAAVDKRVVGLAPLVIDTLNFSVQMKHQKKQWGQYSDQIRDYTSKGLIDLLQKQPKLGLWGWVDPHAYLDRLTQPKLIVNGTNDPYWCVDALNNYWKDLIGQKYALYIPNAGHGLEGGERQLIATLGLFFRSIASGREMPVISWKHEDQLGGLRLEIRSKPEPVAGQLWSARSKTLDFRKSKFTMTQMQRDGDVLYGDVQLEPGGHVVLYGHLIYTAGDLRYGFSTQVRVK